MKDRHFCQNLKFSLKHVNVSLKKKKRWENVHIFLILKKKILNKKRKNKKARKKKK